MVFAVDGVTVNPGTVTVTVTSDSGTVLYTDVATGGSGAAARTYVLETTDTADLDILTLVWTSPTYGDLTTYVEIVGGYYFTIAEARALKALEDAAKYPVAAIVAMRALVEEALEDACGVAFVPRYCRELLSGNGMSTVLLRNPRVTRILDVTLDGDDVSAVSAVLAPTGQVYLSAGWTSGFNNYSVRYEHGHPYPPAEARQAALVLAKNWLVNGPIDDRTMAFSTEDGTFSLSTPGVRGARFGIPVVDSFVQAYNLEPSIA